MKDFLISLIIGPIMFAGFFFVVFNGVGIFTGFEYDSSACYEVRNHTQSNFSYYFFPISTYACKPNGGLLEPGLANFINWLGETHK